MDPGNNVMTLYYYHGSEWGRAWMNNIINSGDLPAVIEIIVGNTEHLNPQYVYKLVNGYLEIVFTRDEIWRLECYK